MIIYSGYSVPRDKPWTPQQHNHIFPPRQHNFGCFVKKDTKFLSIILQPAGELLKEKPKSPNTLVTYTSSQERKKPAS